MRSTLPMTVFWAREAPYAELVLASYEAALEAVVVGLPEFDVAIEVRPPPPPRVPLPVFRDDRVVPADFGRWSA